MTETKLKEDVREFTGYTSTTVLSNNGLDTAFRRAKKHIRVKKSLGLDYDWFDPDNPEAEEALFWFTCLFTKVKTGELDSQDIQTGAVNIKTLLAKADDDVTTWYRNAQSALESINSNTIIQSSSPARTNREYEGDSFGESSGGSSNIDGSNI